ncbi:hypothetical protein [Halorussus halophilus]|uniref:hypothetical protein n=1 Tax=Halorussus halophilus TaxID=2650975 RepID=UPI001301859F|nr:hypothetical protein [Halorussus halophilus]
MARERLVTKQQTEESLLDRRSYLKMAGAAAGAVAATAPASAADSTIGYGEGGYGQTEYGGGTFSGNSPAIDGFRVTKSKRLGSNRMFSVRWAVSDPDENLDVVEVAVNTDPGNVNFSVSNVDGASASGWDLFQFPIGTRAEVSVRVEDASGNTTKRTTTVSL